jgi:hypothetical protein
MNDLLKIVRYSNLFDLNHIMDAIETIHNETNISKNYRGRLSNKKKQKQKDNRSEFLFRIK